MSNLTFIYNYSTENGNDENTKSLVNLLEIYLLFGITNTYSGSFSKVMFNFFNLLSI